MIICLHFTGQCGKLVRIAIMLIILAWSTEGARTVSDHHAGDQTAWCQEMPVRYTPSLKATFP